MLKKKVSNPTDVHIGARIRARRMQQGRSQEWLADQLGLTFQQVQKYEKGMNRVGGSRMQQIANALGVAPSYFFEGGPGHAGDAVKPTKEDEAMRLFTTDRRGLDIVGLWSRLSPKHRAALVTTAEAMAE